jgi:beta-lactam-binding protein with PASTA domain
MLRRFVSWMVLALVLVTVGMVSALTAMRLAIHGREVEVPKVVGSSLREADQSLRGQGLVLDVESHFYSAEVPEGRIVSQVPQPGTRVRRGATVRVAESLGPQRAVIPSVLGQSGRAAEINIRRRGLDVGTVAVVHLPDQPADQVIAQSPPPQAGDALSPKISLLVNAPLETQAFLMPDFSGRTLADAAEAVETAGLKLGTVTSGGARLTLPGGESRISIPATVRRQLPLPGAKVTPGTVVHFEVAR